MQWNFDNSFARELPDFWSKGQAEPATEPRVAKFNHALASELGLDLSGADDAQLAKLLTGGELPAGARPIALAYSGHQFGTFNPQLGDGRALLLGEIIAPDGKRFDLQLKGSGRTAYSRAGDGKAALGPMLREYLISEAMAGLGIPTTRSLGVATTGDLVYRESALPGAVLGRIATSHIRIGSFEYAAAYHGVDGLRVLADYAIARHYPQLADATNPYVALLEAVMNAQIALISRWMAMGFVHGVMNTDNVTISGETIDYGPCAFVDAFSKNAVYSSIDHQGRYAYGNQPIVLRWNIAQLGNAMAQLMAETSDDGIDRANALLGDFPLRFENAWLQAMRAKLGLQITDADDRELIGNLLEMLEAQQVDYTLFFRQLTDDEAAARAMFTDLSAFDNWAEAWRPRIAAESISPAEIAERMRAANPAYIPRNHHVEEALAAAQAGDYRLFDRMLAALATPFIERTEFADLAEPPPADFGHYRTYCGT